MSLKVSITGLKELQATFERLKKPIDKPTATEVGKQVVALMKALISKGISPILGAAKFPNYKDPDKYPRGKKPNTPVNLIGIGKDKGSFQDALTFSTPPGSGGVATEIFYAGNEDLKEQGHRQGVNKQPKRPTIPQGNETFAEKIQEVVRDIYDARINDIGNE